MPRGERGLSVDSETLREIISIAKKRGADDEVPSSPIESASTAFVGELERCVNLLRAEESKLETSAISLVEIIQDNPAPRKNLLQTRIQELFQTLLSRFQALQNNLCGSFDLLRVTAESLDRNRLRTGPQQLCARVQHEAQTLITSSGRMIVLLSDVSTLLQKSEAGEAWIPPSDFERKTTKYWVENAHLAEVMGVTATETPLLVFGKKGLLSDSLKDDGSDILWDQCASKITSVYFDTPDMKFYKERLRRSEGAQLLRVRWYGPKLASHKPVFLELKTHHEEWNGINSIKQRVTVLERSMRSFLSYAPWSRTQAASVIREATPDMPDDELERSVSVLLEMHTLMAKHRMRPCVRSAYARVAFQSSQSNALRFTVDQNVTLYDETQNQSSDWCIPDDALATSKHIVIPYAIFEVKLAGSEMPDSISSLIESGRVVEAYKFSKYLSGAAAFNKVKTLPKWANHPKFKGIYGTESLEDRPTPEKKRSSGDWTKITDKDESSGSNLSEPPRWSFPGRSKVLRRRWRSSKEPKIAPNKPARVEPKSFFANERTFIQWISISLLLATVDTLLPDNGLRVVAWLKFGLMSIVGIMIVYSVAVYYRRLSLMRRGMPYGYTDRIGPVFLLAAVALGGLIIFYRSSDGALGNEVSFLLEGSECVRYAHGLSPLEYEPSDVASFGNMLLIPSLSDVTAISKTTGTTANTLISIPNADIEAIALVDTRIFIVAEGDKNSDLIELVFNNGVMEEVGRWEVNIGYVEGMAYIPDNSLGQLYFGNNEGLIFSAVVPSQENSDEELSVKALNHALFRNGLLNPKIGALQYLEGVLYVLHDNAGIVRCWDVATGVLKAEWKMPVPPDSFGTANEIEGFFLERAPGNLRSNEYLMHLAVDTPAQVWTLRVRVNVNDHSILYPSCARDAIPLKVSQEPPAQLTAATQNIR